MHALNSSKNIKVNSFFSLDSFISLFTLSMKSTMFLSLVPPCICKVLKFALPFPYKIANTSNNFVFPTPVSPINITGILASIFIKILAILI